MKAKKIDVLINRKLAGVFFQRFERFYIRWATKRARKSLQEVRKKLYEYEHLTPPSKLQRELLVHSDKLRALNTLQKRTRSYWMRRPTFWVSDKPAFSSYTSEFGWRVSSKDNDSKN